MVHFSNTIWGKSTLPSTTKHYYRGDEEDDDGLELPYQVMFSKERELYGIVNESGRWVVPPEYDGIEVVAEEGYAICTSNGRYLQVSLSGDIISPFVLNEFRLLSCYDEKTDSYLSSNFATYMVDYHYGLLRLQGDSIYILTEPLFESIEMLTSDVLIATLPMTYREYVTLLDRNGEFINP